MTSLSLEQMILFLILKDMYSQHRYAMVRQQGRGRLMCVALAHPFHHFHLPAAPQGPFTPAPGSRRHSHRYLGCALPGSQPFFSTGSGSSSYLTEIKDGSSQEWPVLNKLRALPAKYLGCDLPSSQTAWFSTDKDPLSLSKVSSMCTTLIWAGGSGG